MLTLEQINNELKRIESMQEISSIYYYFEFLDPDQTDREQFLHLVNKEHLFSKLHLSHIKDLKADLTYKVAEFVWGSIIKKKIELDELYMTISNIVDFINSISPVIELSYFLPYHSEIYDTYLGAVTGYGYRFKLDNGKYYFFAILGND